MTDQTQRVTDAVLAEYCANAGYVNCNTRDVQPMALDLRDSRAREKAKAATIAEQAREISEKGRVINELNSQSIQLGAEVERLKAETARILEIGKRFERDYHNTFEQSCKNLHRAEAAESALATATARIEKLEAALKMLVDRLPLLVWGEAAVPVSEVEAKELRAALSEDKPHG